MCTRNEQEMFWKRKFNLSYIKKNDGVSWFSSVEASNNAWKIELKDFCKRAFVVFFSEIVVFHHCIDDSHWNTVGGFTIWSVWRMKYWKCLISTENEHLPEEILSGYNVKIQNFISCKSIYFGFLCKTNTISTTKKKKKSIIFNSVHAYAFWTLEITTKKVCTSKHIETGACSIHQAPMCGKTVLFSIK